MTWAVKLIKKKVEGLQAHGESDYIYVDDFVLAVLEKNKETMLKRYKKKEADGIKGIAVYQDYLQARAFRELVSALKEVSK